MNILQKTSEMLANSIELVTSTERIPITDRANDDLSTLALGALLVGADPDMDERERAAFTMILIKTAYRLAILDMQTGIPEQPVGDPNDPLF